MTPPPAQPRPTNWRKASASGTGGCVEVAHAGQGQVAVRDSKNPGAGYQLFTAREWHAFLDGVKRGEFDDLAGS